jgi:hypothetical protein
MATYYTTKHTQNIRQTIILKYDRMNVYVVCLYLYGDNGPTIAVFSVHLTFSVPNLFFRLIEG